MKDFIYGALSSEWGGIGKEPGGPYYIDRKGKPPPSPYNPVFC